MHKGVKLLVLFLSLSGFLFTGCHRVSSPPRIVSINEGEPLDVDILDLWSYTEEGEEITVEEVPNVNAKVEISYYETGIGLPTSPKYTAQLTRYTVDFTDVTTTPPTLTNMDKVNGGCNIVIESGDKNVTQSILLVSKEWIEKYSGELENGLVIRARIKFSGIELVSQKEITSTEGYITINMCDFEDDPKKRGS